MTKEEELEEISQQLGHRSEAALRERRSRGEIMLYVKDGWALREFPGGRIERLCLAEEFDASKYPHPTAL